MIAGLSSRRDVIQPRRAKKGEPVETKGIYGSRGRNRRMKVAAKTKIRSRLQRRRMGGA